MNDQFLKELHELEKRRYIRLGEALDITRDLADAVDREDTPSVEMVLSDRQRLILELQELQSHEKLKRVGLTPQEKERYLRLRNGEETPRGAEAAIVQQIEKNRSLQNRLIELDARVNRKLCRDKSFYADIDV